MRPIDSRPVVPEVLSDTDTFAAAVNWAFNAGMRWLAFHLVRLPLYWFRLAVTRSPRGALRIAMTIGRFVMDVHRMPTIEALRGANSPGKSLEEEQERHFRAIRVRATAVAIAVIGVIVGAVLWWPQSPWFVRLVIIVVVPALVGAGGGVEGRPVADRAAQRQPVPRLTTGLIDDALSHLGIGELNKAYAREAKEPGYVAVQFVSEIARHGKGWRVDLDLPAGVTAAEVISRRSKLASGLRRPMGCVWPEVDPDAHEGRLKLHVLDRPLSQQKHRAWPLLDTGRVNVFEPVQIGVAPTGEPVTVLMMFASGLIGAVPRMGKTALLRLLCLAAGLDPRCELHVFNLKGGGDYNPLASIAHTYRSGDDPEDLTIALQALRRIREDMRRRYKKIGSLDRSICPESKITDELASVRNLRLHPILIAVDECQLWFESDQGSDFKEVVGDLIRRGPAVGIMIWLATQRPDSDSIPTVVTANAVVRLCLKVTDQTSNDMVLGTSAYKNGYRATVFSRKDLGVAWLAGEGDDPVIVRADYVDTEQADKVASRARAVRRRVGSLTGQAAGEEPDTVDVDMSSVLDHLDTIWPDKRPSAHNEELAELLAGQWPGRYQGWTSEQLTAAVKPHGIETRDVRRKGVTRRGISRTDLDASLADRVDPEPVYATEYPDIDLETEQPERHTEPVEEARVVLGALDPDDPAVGEFRSVADA